MISARAFNEAFCYQVNQLGNIVRGLEMIAEYLEQHWSRGASQTLTQDCQRLLAHVPRGRLSPELVTRLHALSLLNEAEESDTQHRTGIHSSPSNTVLLLLVDQCPQPSGLVRELWMEPTPPYAQRGGFPMEAADDFCQVLIAGCLAAAQVLERIGIPPVYKLPEDYVFHVTSGAFGGNPRLQGTSVWLAGALSYFALWSGLHLPGVVAATGSLEQSGQIGSVRDVAVKLNACLRERPDVAHMLVLTREALPAPYRHDPRVRRVSSLEDTLQALWGAEWPTRVMPPTPSVYAAVDRATHTYHKEGNFPEALARFSVLSRFFAQAPQFPRRYRFLCDWRCTSCHTHMGRPDRARPLFQPLAAEAAVLWQAGDLSSEDYTNFFASYGVYLQDTFAFQQGAELLSTVRDQIAAYRVTHIQRARLCGTLGQLLMFRGAYQEAEPALWQAYELVDEEERPRNCIYLGQLYILWQRYDEARRCLDEGQQRNSEIRLPGQQRVNALFHGVWRARLCYAEGDFARAIAEAEAVLALRRGCEHGMEAITAFLAATFQPRYVSLLTSKKLGACLDTVRSQFRNPACHGIATFDLNGYARFVRLVLAQQCFLLWDSDGPTSDEPEADVGVLHHHLRLSRHLPPAVAPDAVLHTGMVMTSAAVQEPGSTAVFLSYAHADQAQVEVVADHLQAAGVAVWLDPGQHAGVAQGTGSGRTLRSPPAGSCS